MLKTHRCQQSLDNRTPIRFSESTSQWYLYEHYIDFDYDKEGIRKVCPINYCPFCGKKLEVEECA